MVQKEIIEPDLASRRYSLIYEAGQRAAQAAIRYPKREQLSRFIHFRIDVIRQSANNALTPQKTGFSHS